MGDENFSRRALTIKALAVTSPQRSPVVPDLPTLAESGLPAFDTTAWLGLFAPAGIPKDVVAKLRVEVDFIVHEPDIRALIVATFSYVREVVSAHIAAADAGENGGQYILGGENARIHIKGEVAV